MKAQDFVKECKKVYGKPIPENKNAMEVIAQNIDIKEVKGFSWINMGKSWGIAEAELLKKYPKETGSLRVLWYRSFKSYSQHVMKGNVDLDKANMLLSTGLSALVREGYQYSDFAVEDAAYCAEFDEAHIKNLNAVLFVEKSSEFPKFKRSCEILGIKALVQGSGRPNFSTSEYIYKHYFEGKITENTPLRMLILTDEDYDGRLPIAEGFKKQMIHYAKFVKSARVGICMSQIPEKRRNVKDALYEVKQDNKNRPKAEWMAENLIKDPKTGRYLGAEVEANPFSFYYPLIWDALKRTGITYNDLVEARYQNIQPNKDQVAKQAAEKLLKDELKEIDEEIRRLQNLRNQKINDKKNEVLPIVKEEGNKEDYIYFQKAKGEDSIIKALKDQRSWSGGLKVREQFNELVKRVINRVTKKDL